MADQNDFHVGDVVNLGAPKGKGKIIQITKPLGSYKMYTVHTYAGEVIKLAKHQLVKCLPDEEFEELQNSISRPTTSTETRVVESDINIENVDIPSEVLQEMLNNSEMIEQTRFATVNVDQFITENENKNTKRKTQGHLNLLREFFEVQDEFRDIHDIPPDELDQLLSQFFVSVRQKNGSDYEPTTLRNMLSSFERELRDRQYSDSLVNSIKFAKTRAALKSKQKDLKKSGLGNKVNSADRITDAEIDQLFECGELGVSSPNSILNTLWFYNTLLFGMRGGAEEHRALCWGDVRLGYDSDLNKEYLEYNERQTKTRTGADLSLFRTKPRMYANLEAPNRCPITIYKTYRDLRPSDYSSDEHPFYIAATTVKNPGNYRPWFAHCPLGKNKIKSLMKTMVANANLDTDRRLTNTSVRKHLCQKLLENQVPDTQAVQITGHKNPNSLNNYRQISNAQKNQISVLLSDTNGKIHTDSPPAHSTHAANTRSGPTSIHVNDVTCNTATQSTQQASKSVLGGSVIHGGVFNITIVNNFAPNPPKRRRVIIDSDSD